MAVKRTFKECGVEELQAGMVVGKSIFNDNGKELIAEGTVLTNRMIFSLLDRPIVSVVIEIKEKMPVELKDDKVFETSYIAVYDRMIAEVRDLMEQARKMRAIDVGAFERLVDGGFMELVNGMKAISHIHNISRKEGYLSYHTVNVAILAGILGKWLHLPEAKVRDLVLAGLLHDIGKSQIDPGVLEKPGKLTPEELRAVRAHASKGYELIKYTSLKQDILFGVLQHHERSDGSGYPAGVDGSRINTFAKILAIVDVYDAMAADKVYAKRQSPFVIFEQLSEDMLQRLDTKSCVVFVKKVYDALNGSWVELSDGTRAKIVYIDESRVQPLPVVCCEESGEFVDLNRRRDLSIARLLTHEEIES